jgi:hypothetical protein
MVAMQVQLVLEYQYVPDVVWQAAADTSDRPRCQIQAIACNEERKTQDNHKNKPRRLSSRDRFIALLLTQNTYDELARNILLD